MNPLFISRHRSFSLWAFDNKITTSCQPEMCPCQQHDHMWRSVVLASRVSGWCRERWPWDTDFGLHPWLTRYPGSKVALAQTPWWNCCHYCRTRDKQETCRKSYIMCKYIKCHWYSSFLLSSLRWSGIHIIKIKWLIILHHLQTSCVVSPKPVGRKYRNKAFIYVSGFLFLKIR